MAQWHNGQSKPDDSEALSIRKGTGSPKAGPGWIPTANPFGAF